MGAATVTTWAARRDVALMEQQALKGSNKSFEGATSLKRSSNERHTPGTYSVPLTCTPPRTPCGPRGRRGPRQSPRTASVPAVADRRTETHATKNQQSNRVKKKEEKPEKEHGLRAQNGA